MYTLKLLRVVQEAGGTVGAWQPLCTDKLWMQLAALSEPPTLRGAVSPGPRHLFHVWELHSLSPTLLQLQELKSD